MKNKYARHFIQNAFGGFLILLLTVSIGNAQLLIEVDAPQLLVPNKPIYMASDLNNWNPGHPDYLLKKNSNGKYYLTLPDTLRFFEYKFTQGSWNTVEATVNGTLLSNRIYNKQEQIGLQKISDVIKGWEKRSSFTLNIINYPENTPEDARIYVAGNFNNWKEHDENYVAQKQFDGTFKLTIFTDLEEIEFKFNRGNWDSAEGRKDGRPRPNRKLHLSDLDEKSEADITIESWEDMFATFNFYSIFDLLLLFSSFQGILLAITIPSIQDFNRKANRWLVILLLFSSSLILIRVVGNFREVANTFPKLTLLPMVILFTYAPMFYLYLKRLLFNQEVGFREILRRFIPLIIQVLILLPYFFLESKRFQYKVVNDEHDLLLIYVLCWIAALFFNLYYWLKSKNVLLIYENKYQNVTAYHQNIQYLSAAQYIHLACIVLGALTGILFVLQYYFEWDISEVSERSINAIWFVFSLMGYLLGYYAINQPEIFKLSGVDAEQFTKQNQQQTDELFEPVLLQEKQAEKEKIAEVHDENFVLLKAELKHYFENEKPFLNPNLTINDLAQHLNTPSYIVSRVINEGFEKNFFDFVNYYRVIEFKEQINNPKFKNYTLLSIAFEVGFNSKTSFNRAFKKITNQTPSEFYHSRTQ